MVVQVAQLVVIVLLVVLLVVRERDHDNRISEERDLASAERSATALEAAHERVEHTALVERLLQRIQAPEAAVVEHTVAQPFVSPPAVTPDDDMDFWEARLGKDELAEILMAQEQAAAVNNG